MSTLGVLLRRVEHRQREHERLGERLPDVLLAVRVLGRLRLVGVLVSLLLQRLNVGKQRLVQVLDLNLGFNGLVLGGGEKISQRCW